MKANLKYRVLTPLMNLWLVIITLFMVIWMLCVWSLYFVISLVTPMSLAKHANELYYNNIPEIKDYE